MAPLKTKKGELSIRSVEELKKLVLDTGVSSFEVIPLATPLSFEKYQDWLAQGFQGDMDYMQKNWEARKKPQEHFGPMRSIIMFTQDYFPVEEAYDSPLFPSLKIAHYARNKDYHFWFRQKLNDTIEKLQKQFPQEKFLAFTDAVPLLERDHAAQAALGWIGKNTCLIHPKKGSLFFIGEILTTIECQNQPDLMHDFCGKCRACIDVCPTQALNENRQLDAKLCLAHWNIESRETPPEEIREKMQDWFFGCDLCQTACPWNIKLFKNNSEFVQTTSDKQSSVEELRFILESSNKKLLKLVKETPLSRAGGRGLKRNALIVIANLNIHELTDLVATYQDHEYLGELAQWVLKKLTRHP